MNSLIHFENNVRIINSLNANRAIGPKFQSSKRVYKRSYKKTAHWMPYLAVIIFVGLNLLLSSDSKKQQTIV